MPKHLAKTAAELKEASFRIDETRPPVPRGYPYDSLIQHEC